MFELEELFSISYHRVGDNTPPRGRALLAPSALSISNLKKNILSITDRRILYSPLTSTRKRRVDEDGILNLYLYHAKGSPRPCVADVPRRLQHYTGSATAQPLRFRPDA
ncbi:hypothetical protein EVAR_69995_1 [Eumeta japonica]|uniref:Uncharacterized protein n=1 Tax=Eumeta variegata TaxID=151549 RepID=A0A4C2A6I4_EUMVA|nr:hypothetical protein EVAR_69995_1 [Eumeta japonica]